MKVDDLFFRSSTQTGLVLFCCCQAEPPFKNPRSTTGLGKEVLSGSIELYNGGKLNYYKVPIQ